MGANFGDIETRIQTATDATEYLEAWCELLTLTRNIGLIIFGVSFAAVVIEFLLQPFSWTFELIMCLLGFGIAFFSSKALSQTLRKLASPAELQQEQEFLNKREAEREES